MHNIIDTYFCTYKCLILWISSTIFRRYTLFHCMDKINSFIVYFQFFPVTKINLFLVQVYSLTLSVAGAHLCSSCLADSQLGLFPPQRPTAQLLFLRLPTAAALEHWPLIGCVLQKLFCFLFTSPWIWCFWPLWHFLHVFGFFWLLILPILSFTPLAPGLLV